MQKLFSQLQACLCSIRTQGIHGGKVLVLSSLSML
jgi:hypothetical protein